MKQPNLAVDQASQVHSGEDKSVSASSSFATQTHSGEDKSVSASSSSPSSESFPFLM
jgi:hypothetical protein